MKRNGNAGQGLIYIGGLFIFIVLLFFQQPWHYIVIESVAAIALLVWWLQNEKEKAQLQKEKEQAAALLEAQNDLVRRADQEHELDLANKLFDELAADFACDPNDENLNLLSFFALKYPNLVVHSAFDVILESLQIIKKSRVIDTIQSRHDVISKYTKEALNSRHNSANPYVVQAFKNVAYGATVLANLRIYDAVFTKSQSLAEKVCASKTEPTRLKRTDELASYLSKQSSWHGILAATATAFNELNAMPTLLEKDGLSTFKVNMLFEKKELEKIHDF